MGRRYNEFMANFKHNPDTFNAEEFTAALNAAVKADDDDAQAAVTAKEQEVAGLNTQVTELGAANWKMLTKLGNPDQPVPTPPPGSREQSAGGDPNESELKGTSSFFDKKE